MKITMIATLLVGLAFAGSAEAATTKRCGSLGVDGKRYRSGAGSFNITVRVSTCGTAKAVVRGYRFGQGEKVRGFTCRNSQSGGESTTVRCTRYGGRVIRWTSAA